jgi:hypothetical protein
MPGYKSRKNLRKSKNKSKTGGRRRKYTVKKVRRGRKVMRGGGDIVTFDDLETKLNEKGAMEPFLKLLQCGSTFEYFKQDVWDEYKVKKNDVEYEEDKINIKKIIDDYFSEISNTLDDKTVNILKLKRLAFNNISESDELLLEQTLQELQELQKS